MNYEPRHRKGLRLEEHQATFDLNTTSTAGSVRYVFYVQDTNNYQFVEIPWDDNTQQTCTLGKVVDGGEAETITTGNITLDDATTYEVRITVEGQDVKVEYSAGSWTTVFDTSGNDYLPSDSGGRLGFAITSGTACLDDVAVMTDPAGGTSFVDSQMATEDFASGTISPTYDDAGNLTSDGVRGYVYDAWNRLVQVTRDGSNVNATSEEVVIATLTYDGLGRRISKQITDSADQDATLHYYYDGARLVEARDGSDSTLQRYVWGAGYVDELVQIGQGLSGGDMIAQEFYVMQDANYNVLGVATDYGRLVERYEYTPYGQRTVFSRGWLLADADDDGDVDSADHDIWSASYQGSYDARADFDGDGSVTQDDEDIWTACNGDSLPDEDTDPLVTRPALGSFRHAMNGVGLCEVGHQGVLHDEGFGLVYNRRRMYDPGKGRFLQRDRARNQYADGMNLYQYVLSSPVRFMDPSGRYGVDIHFYMTYYLAKKCGFTQYLSGMARDGKPFTEAFVMAWADQYTDVHPQTEPWLNAGRFHFVTSPIPFARDRVCENSDEANAIVDAGIENNSLMQTGIGLHAYQDSWSHAGYTPFPGHIADGHKPDQPWRRPQTSMTMARFTYEKLGKLMKKRHCKDCQADFDTFRSELDMIIRAAQSEDANGRAATWQTHLPGVTYGDNGRRDPWSGEFIDAADAIRPQCAAPYEDWPADIPYPG